MIFKRTPQKLHIRIHHTCTVFLRVSAGDKSSLLSFLFAEKLQSLHLNRLDFGTIHDSSSSKIEDGLIGSRKVLSCNEK